MENNQVAERTSAVIERARADASQRESEAKQRLRSNSIDEGFALVELIPDADGRLTDLVFLETNQAYRRLSGFDDDAGNRLRDFMPDVDQEWMDFFANVALTGQSARMEFSVELTRRWLTVFASRVGGEGSLQLAVVFNDITERKRAEAALRESDERHAFLLKLSDEFRAARDPETIGTICVDSLARHMKLDRCFINEMRSDENLARVGPEFRSPGLTPVSGDQRYADFPATMRRVKAGEPVLISNVAGDAGLTDLDKASLAAMAIGAVIVGPLRRGAEKSIWALTVSTVAPRQWTRDDFHLVQDVAERTWAAMERSRGEAALRESEERHAFLLALSDALRKQSDPSQRQRAGMQLLGEYLNVDRAFYFDAHREDGEWIHTVESDYLRTAGAPSMVGRYPQTAFGDGAFAEMEYGKSAIAREIRRHPLITAEQQQRYAALNVATYAAVPVLKGGLYVGGVCVQDSTPRDWSATDIALIREVAERTWSALEQARAEKALRESQERFLQFARASAAVLWLRDAGTLQMEYVSPVISKIYGIGPEAYLGDIKRWAATIVPDDRDDALAQIELARGGEAVVHEFRIQRPSDQAFRWIRNTSFPLFDETGKVHRIGGIAEDVTEAKLAIEHQGVLMAELQHRVRNIMAIINSVVARTGERARNVEEYAGLVAGRIGALSRVQVLLTRAANSSVSIATIVRDEVNAQAQHEGQCVIEGSELALAPKIAEVLTLAVHELTTNALKYGALSVADGKVTVRWHTFDKHGTPWLAFDWSEEGAPQRSAARTQQRGFGSELIERRIPYELGGRANLIVEAGGAKCHLEFPLEGGPSILETDAPQRAQVFGGALDMTAEANLSGYRVLVVEDDYFLATDTVQALRGAGAEVIGPCATEVAARSEIIDRSPDAVVVDVNLGSGPSFKLAETLKDRGIPFVFVTGYDQKVIPKEFAHIERIEKPAKLRRIVGAIAKLFGKSA